MLGTVMVCEYHRQRNDTTQQSCGDSIAMARHAVISVEHSDLLPQSVPLIVGISSLSSIALQEECFSSGMHLYAPKIKLGVVMDDILGAFRKTVCSKDAFRLLSGNKNFITNSHLSGI
jgi:hypothetical protein